VSGLGQELYEHVGCPEFVRIIEAESIPGRIMAMIKYGLVSFAGPSLGMYEYCNYQRRREKRGLQMANEIMEYKRVEKEKRAQQLREEKRQEEEKRRTKEQEAKKGSRWW
jgi:cytochrome c oxidase assembly protein subunit 20